MVKQNKILSLLLCLCLGVLSVGFATAQDQPIVLTENYTSAADRVVFLYPTGWIVDKQNSYVSVSDTQTTIEFYTVSLSQGVIDLANKNLEASVLAFLNILGKDALGVDILPTQATQVILKEDTIIGTSILNAGELQYVLLVKGLLMDDPGYVFVRVKGSALDLISSPDEFIAIIKTFGTFVTPESATSATATNPNIVAIPTLVPNGTTNTVTTTEQGRPAAKPTTIAQPTTAPAVPCTVTATQANTAQLRVGPGENRSILLFLSPNDTYEVIGTANDNKGARWWRLDKTKAAPAKASVVNETWVSDAQMTESGDCDAVGTVSAPPIIRIRPTAAPVSTSAPNATAQPTPLPGSTDPFISFFADPAFINQGDCTTLFWDVRNVKEIHLIDDFGSEKGITGPTGSELVCPLGGLGFNFAIYTLRVVPLTGADIFREVSVTINTTTQCLIPYPSLFESGRLDNINVHSYNIFVDTSCGGGANVPATVYIDVIADDSNMDPFMDVYLDGGYFDSDDDSGFNLDTFMQFDIFAPTSIAIDVFNLLPGPGNYSVSIFIEQKR